MNKEPKTTQEGFLFGRKNYFFMLIGLLLIVLGFLLMSGSDANTNAQGVYNRNYFNEAIFSFRRIRLAPVFIITGFIVEVIAIVSSETPNNKKT